MKSIREFDVDWNERPSSRAVATLPGSARIRVLAEREVEMEKLLLSPADAAAHLSIGRSKVYELMRLGQLRSVKIGALRRIP